MLALLLLVLAASASAATYAKGLDIYQPGNSSTFTCIYSYGYSTVFVRAYKPDLSGSVDYNAVQSIKYASNARLGVEVYMTPAPKSSKTAATQVDEALNALANGGITVRTLWLQVTSPVNWNSAQATNNNFILAAASRIRARGVRPGVYTSTYDWQQITNNAKNTGSDVLLWYWHVNGQGVSGETSADFSDFRGFGNWNTTSSVLVKQFGQNEPICGLTVNRDVYPTSGVTKFTQMINRAIAIEKKTIVAGAIGL